MTSKYRYTVWQDEDDLRYVIVKNDNLFRTMWCDDFFELLDVKIKEYTVATISITGVYHTTQLKEIISFNEIVNFKEDYPEYFI